MTGNEGGALELHETNPFLKGLLNHPHQYILFGIHGVEEKIRKDVVL